jgi:hypothetical protein
MSCRFPPVRVTASGMPWASTIRWCLEPGWPRLTGEGPTWSPFECVHVRGVHRAPLQVEQAGGAQLGQQQLVQGGPHAGLGPVPHPPPADDSGAAEHLRGQLVPGDAGLEHEHDPGQRDRQPSWEPAPARWAGRQQRRDQLPQRVRNKILDDGGQRGPTGGLSTADTPHSF